MLYKEILLGFLLAGFIGLLPNSFFASLFLSSAPAPVRLLENVIVGPLVAVLSFVCSVGNIPLAAVLWSGGIGFGGVIAFIFADLLVLPIVAIYRKYYGTRFTVRIVALMFVTIVLAALAVDGLFSAAGLIPQTRPSRSDIFGSVSLNYKLFTNILGLAVFAALFALTMRRGATDPVCGMSVDRAKAVRVEQAGRRATSAQSTARGPSPHRPPISTIEQKQRTPILPPATLVEVLRPPERSTRGFQLKLLDRAPADSNPAGAVVLLPTYCKASLLPTARRRGDRGAASP